MQDAPSLATIMPLMNGLEETRVLKKLMPALPVIIYTAHSSPLVEKEALAVGESAVICSNMLHAAWDCETAAN